MCCNATDEPKLCLQADEVRVRRVRLGLRWASAGVVGLGGGVGPLLELPLLLVLSLLLRERREVEVEVIAEPLLCRALRQTSGGLLGRGGEAFELGVVAAVQGSRALAYELGFDLQGARTCMNKGGGGVNRGRRREQR